MNIIITHYLYLIKPRIILGNLMSCIGGFLMASYGHINYTICIYTVIGLSLIIASSCAMNNIIDRDIDSIMYRTKFRVLAQKKISIKNSIYYAVILSILGFLFLGYTKNVFTILFSTIGLCTYVGIYSLWMKRKSIYSIIIGSISGSMPPAIGYCAATNQLDIGVLLLIMTFSFWQISHSYAITIFQSQDYKIALIPTFFEKNGIKSTKTHIILNILGFIVSTFILTIMGYTSYNFLYIITTFNLFWLYKGTYAYQAINNDIKWAKKMFIWSIIIIMIFNLLLSLDSILIKNFNK